MIDLSSNYISYLLPMINWFIPKKGVKLSVKEVEKTRYYKASKKFSFKLVYRILCIIDCDF
ncbi:DUF443 family protein [Staphylococcus aureus]|uniref:DUF443 family protein n=1 Tax=Staphylococcus aureus TaxID=1280 RepID=UPI001FB92DBA|nr:DUF443 family protein [Staphylococcus aureus]